MSSFALSRGPEDWPCSRSPRRRPLSLRFPCLDDPSVGGVLEVAARTLLLDEVRGGGIGGLPRRSGRGRAGAGAGLDAGTDGVEVWAGFGEKRGCSSGLFIAEGSADGV